MDARPPALTGPALAVHGLDKVYAASGKRGARGHGPAGGVRGASFTLQPGTFFTLLGPSGCGKTTTLRSIAGLERPDGGSIALGEQVFFDAARGIDVPLNRRNIGMVFQSYAIWPHMTVFENVAFPLRVARDRRYDRAEVGRLVGAALEVVSLAGFGDRPATRLSGGQQQRVALARAIVRQPRLLLLDEPLSNLDAALREEMRTELKRLQRDLGITTVYVTHDQSEALDMSDAIAVMQGGRIVQMGAPRDIYFRPRNAFVAGFVGATNLLRGTVGGDASPDGAVSVVLEGGQALRCAVPHAPLAAGGRTAVSVRPEALTLGAAAAPAREGWNRLEGVVASVGFQGNLNRYGIRLDGCDTLVHANTGPEAAFPVGSRIGLHFPYAGAIAVPDEEHTP